MKNGFIYSCNWILFYKNDQLIYGFFVQEKGSKDYVDRKTREDFRQAFEATEYLRGNTQGNEFLKTQINYNG